VSCRWFSRQFSERCSFGLNSAGRRIVAVQKDTFRLAARAAQCGGLNEILGMTIALVQHTKLLAAVALALLFIGFLYGCIPGYSLPTLGQALWASGFAQSFANQSIWTIHANNFGFPEPAAMAFGLSGAWITGIFIRIGIHPADAYSLNFFLWLSISFLSAFRLALEFKASNMQAYLAALLWLSMPIIWGNSGFSMLALGFSLLPLYFLLAYWLFTHHPRQTMRSLVLGLSYALTVLIAVFMDGYSFVMFGAVSTGLGLFLLFQKQSSARTILLFSFPTHVVSFLLAYICYTNYVGVFDYETHSMEYFRGAGLDLSFVVIPSAGQHWILDNLGMSTVRKASDYFGHFSGWTTTFSLPIIILGILSWVIIRKKVALSTGLLILFIFSAYMALGPSLKINSMKLPEDIARTSLPYMPAERGVMPTGNEFIYKMPGFKQMRLPFRWLALSIFCVWLLSVMYLGLVAKRKKLLVIVVFLFLFLLNLPNIVDRNNNRISNREMFLAIDKDLVGKITQIAESNSTVLFLPYRNDWMINYVAARSKIQTYNIGGDKNLRLARQKWPESMTGLKYGELSYPQLLEPLIHDDADFVFVTYFNSLTSSFRWPCTRHSTCPDEYRLEYSPIIRKIQDRSGLSIIDTDLFTAIGTRPH